jgi:hypothetical protein
VLTYFAGGHAITNFRFFYFLVHKKKKRTAKRGDGEKARATNEDVREEMNGDRAENTDRCTVGIG